MHADDISFNYDVSYKVKDTWNIRDVLTVSSKMQLFKNNDDWI